MLGWQLCSLIAGVMLLTVAKTTGFIILQVWGYSFLARDGKFQQAARICHGDKTIAALDSKWPQWFSANVSAHVARQTLAQLALAVSPMTVGLFPLKNILLHSRLTK